MMKIPILSSLLLGFLLAGYLPTYGQSSGPTSGFANLVIHSHGCDEGGEILFELNGDREFYTYYWTHGPVSLHLTDLDPGLYTLVVRNFYGCEETYEVEILSFDACSTAYTLASGQEKCTIIVNVEVYNENTGALYDPELITITWADDPDAGFTRIVNQYAIDFTYHYTITTNDGGSASCCYIEQPVLILADERNCNDRFPPTGEMIMIVNEFAADLQGKGQFIELLVMGDLDCSGTTDIRGFILDDNDGQLIPAGNLIHKSNAHLIGINEGYLQLLYHPNWAAIPNGSLILIYEDGLVNTDAFPADDPEDANGDGVYVLAASNQKYIHGKSGKWNEKNRSMDYTGTFDSPSWSPIRINGTVDGIQIRNPDAVLSHGVSTGQNYYSNGKEHELKIGTGEAVKANCQFILTDYLDETHFECYFDEGSSASPGLPNSTANQLLINALLDCDDRQTPRVAEESLATTAKNNLLATSDREDELQVFPNPTAGAFNLSYNSSEDGEGAFRLFTMSGQLISFEQIPCRKGANRRLIEETEMLPSGVYFIQLTFPSGKVVRSYLVVTK